MITQNASTDGVAVDSHINIDLPFMQMTQDHMSSDKSNNHSVYIVDSVESSVMESSGDISLFDDQSDYNEAPDNPVIVRGGDTRIRPDFGEVTQPLDDSDCEGQVYFYLTVVLGSVLVLFIIFLLFIALFVWRKYIRREDIKKVSRAESWRYEANIYINPGRQLSSVPVYPSVATSQSASTASTAPAPVVLPYATPNNATNQSRAKEVSRNSRLLSADIIEEESSNYNTLERISLEGSTREATPNATPQNTPLLGASRRDSVENIDDWSTNTTLNRQNQRSRVGASPLTTPHGSPLLARARLHHTHGHTGHSRTGSLSGALRGVDIIRCTTPGHPPPSPPISGRIRQLSLGENPPTERRQNNGLSENE